MIKHCTWNSTKTKFRIVKRHFFEIKEIRGAQKTFYNMQLLLQASKKRKIIAELFSTFRAFD